MRLSELIPFLSSLGVSPKKGLSQNFLIDSNITNKIVQTADVQPNETILEIGPGPGALTEILLAKGARVIAIEKDRVLAGALLRLQTPDQRLTVHCDDALTFPWDTIQYDKIVANLPYHITTPLLEKCFAHPCASVTCMIQKEVADRIGALPGNKTFGSLTLFTQFYATLLTHFTVSSQCFYPKPSVDSTVIHLKLHTTPTEGASSFFPLMRAAFQQRRKCLSTSLKSFFPADHIRKALQSISVREDARPETLSLEKWLQFVKQLTA
jgi:16S rRNA (adenine1518-N6/adenine1519-N6)-dimethyltransferase